MIRKSDIYHAGVLLVLVTAFSFVMMNNDYNSMLDDLDSGRYTVYEGKYNDFKEFDSGLTIAENGVVYRNVYMGYINNTVVDNSSLGDFGTNNDTETNKELLEGAKWETLIKMTILHLHYVMALLVFLMYRLVDYILVGVIGANRLFIKHRGDISDDNFNNVLRDFKEIYKIYYNRMQILATLIFGLITTFLIRMSVNLDDFRLVYLILISYSLFTVLNYCLKLKIVKEDTKKGELNISKDKSIKREENPKREDEDKEVGGEEGNEEEGNEEDEL